MQIAKSTRRHFSRMQTTLLPTDVDRMTDRHDRNVTFPQLRRRTVIKLVSAVLCTIYGIKLEDKFTGFILLLNTEYASSSDSESEQQLVDQAWRGDVDSDAESIDSEQEDSLKYVNK